MINTHWDEVFNLLWNFVLSVVDFMATLWHFLITRVEIGFDISLVDIPVVGNLINWFILLLNYYTVSFVPLFAFGGSVIIILLTLYLIKTFIPIA